MKKLNIALLLDSILFGFCVFFLSFTLLQYFIRRIAITLCISIMFGVAFAILSCWFFAKRRHTKLLKATELKNLQRLRLHLALLPEQQLFQLLGTAFSLRKHNKFLINDNQFVAPYFGMNAVNEEQVAALIRVATQKQKLILCGKISEDAYALAKLFHIEILEIETVYHTLEQKDLLPQNFLGESTKTPFWKNFRPLQRKWGLPFLGSGLTFLFFSWFALFPLYYLICGGLMTLFGLLVLLLTKTNRQF